ncbi:MAG: transporter substrate-binding domain-containing protein [Bacteroidetes bacterium]|nr:transporter substrate-binding domain-containing protein [Bacteroidota bacterium]
MPIRIILSSLFFALATGLFAQSNLSWESALKNKKASLNVYYYENNYPFTYKEKGNVIVKGIEADILNEFVGWAKKKGVVITLNYIASAEFNKSYELLTKGTPNSIGLSSLTITEDRKKEIQFCPPYLKNKTVLISSGRIPTLSKIQDISLHFDTLTAITEKGSTHEKYLLDLKSSYFPKMRIEFGEENPTVKINQNAKYFGYVDMIQFWSFLKKNNSSYIKMHRVATIDNERFAFGLPLNSDWQAAFNEFFESGFGFISTKKYRSILETHLSSEVIESVELD